MLPCNYSSGLLANYQPTCTIPILVCYRHPMSFEPAPFWAVSSTPSLSDSPTPQSLFSRHPMSSGTPPCCPATTHLGSWPTTSQPAFFFSKHPMRFVTSLFWAVASATPRLPTTSQTAKPQFLFSRHTVNSVTSLFWDVPPSTRPWVCAQRPNLCFLRTQ